MKAVLIRPGTRAETQSITHMKLRQFGLAPLDVRAVHLHAMEDVSEPACQCNVRSFETATLGDLPCPSGETEVTTRITRFPAGV